MAKRPVRFDFDIYAERTFRKKWRYRNPRNPDGTPGDPVDLTGWHARLIVPVLGGDPANPEDYLRLSDTSVDQFPSGAAITIDGPAGEFEWVIPDEVTAVLDFPKSAYFFDFKDPAGDWLPYMRGEARLWKTR